MKGKDQKKGRRRVSDEAGKKIVFRVTSEEFERLQKEAEGHSTVSALVRAKVFAGGVRNRDVLRQVAALHVLGMQVKALAGQPNVPVLEAQATLMKVQQAIEKLARRVPEGEAEGAA